jgi:hypothetical protein
MATLFDIPTADLPDLCTQCTHCTEQIDQVLLKTKTLKLEIAEGGEELLKISASFVKNQISCTQQKRHPHDPNSKKH